jgi:hypothetical protein
MVQALMAGQALQTLLVVLLPAVVVAVTVVEPLAATGQHLLLALAVITI